MDYTVKDVLARLILELRGEVEGVKKLMKLVFLVQYEPLRRLPLAGRAFVKYLYGGKPVARAEFYIWSFGPMSNEVYEALEEGPFTIEAGEPPYVVRYEGPEPRLPEPVVERIKHVVAKYGELMGWQLERKVIEMLKLTPEEKKLYYMGWPVDKYLRFEGARLEERELGRGQDTDCLLYTSPSPRD